jgi:hypothetical protein
MKAEIVGGKLLISEKVTPDERASGPDWNPDLNRIAALPPMLEEMEAPMFAIPKCESGIPLEGKWRQIMNSSWPNPALGLSMNDLLNFSQRTVTYTAFDKMVRMFRQIGPGGWIFKVDFEKAYRMLAIHPLDWPFMGVNAAGIHAVDTRIVFGAGEAPAEFTSFADCIKWDLQAKIMIRWIEHYLDDFVGGESTKTRADLALRMVLTELNIMGVTVNMEKVFLSQNLVVLGVEVDMINMTISVPARKVDLICEKIDKIMKDDAEGKCSMTLKELRSLTGLIGTCAMVVRQGRIYTQYIHDELAKAERRVDGISSIPPGMGEELRWWLDTLRNGCATQMMLDERMERTPFSPFSDASSEYGMAGLYGMQAYQHKWTELEKRIVDRYVDGEARIAIGEMAAVCVTAGLFKSQWIGKVVEFRCDNTTVCTAVNSGKCKVARVREMVKWLAHLAASNRKILFFNPLIYNHLDK